MLIFLFRWLRVAIAFSLLQGAAYAQSHPLVSNVFSQSDLRQAIEDIAAQSGVNIIMDQSVQGVISVTLDNETIEGALQLVLAGTEYEFQAKDDYYIVYGSDEQSDVFSRLAPTEVVSVNFVPAETARSLLPPALQRYVRVDAAANTLAITAPEQLSDRILKDLAAIDLPASDNTAYLQLNHVKAATAVAMLPDTLRRYVRVDAERNILAITAPPSEETEIVGNIRRLDRPRAPGSFDVPDIHPTQLVKLQHAKALTTLALLPTAVQALVRADERTNTLAVSAPDHLVGRILADIATIDAPRRHIMLDARVVVLERADLLDFGAEWQLPTVTAGTLIGNVAGATGWPWELRIGYAPGREFTNALSLTLNMMSENNEATIIASPQVLAQDGIESEIRVTTEEYFQITANAGTFITADLEKIETGTILKIVPQIGPTGELTLEMNIEVSDVVSRGQQNLPVVSRRTARSTVQVENGGTAAIAGLADTRSQLSRGGIPGSQSVPILGRAFRTDKLNHQTRQVAVFVTATLVDHPDAKLHSKKPLTPPLGPIDEAAYQAELEAALGDMVTPQ